MSSIDNLFFGEESFDSLYSNDFPYDIPNKVILIHAYDNIFVEYK